MTKLQEVKDAFSTVPGSQISHVPLEGHYAQVTVSEKQAGQLFRALRTNGFEFRARRINNNLVAHVEIEEPGKLESLFS